MDPNQPARRRWLLIPVLLVVVGFVGAQGGDAKQVAAQLSADELDELVKPVALYPDELLSLVFAASTQPFEIMEAVRFLAMVEGKVPDKLDVDWDESVKELLSYPELLQSLNKDLEWVTRLGQAVRDQQSGVMDAVQRMRRKAYDVGNLKSNENVEVSVDGDIISITLKDDEEMVAPQQYDNSVYYTHGWVWRSWWRWPCWRWRVYRCYWRYPRAVHFARRPHNPRYRGRANRPQTWRPRATRRSPAASNARAGVKPATSATVAAARVRGSRVRPTSAAASRGRPANARAQASSRQTSFDRSRRASEARRASQRGAASRTRQSQSQQRRTATRSTQKRTRSSAYNRSYSTGHTQRYSSRGRSSRSGGGSRGGGGGGGGGRR